jgi:hypothetical protein
MGEVISYDRSLGIIKKRNFLRLKDQWKRGL